MDKEKLEIAAKGHVYHRAGRPYNRGNDFHKAVKEAFIAGADWRINSLWVKEVHNEDDNKVEKSYINTPKDGTYLTVLKRLKFGKSFERFFVEVAPWRHGEYQGNNHIGVVMGQLEVVMYANLDDLLPFKEDDI